MASKLAVVCVLVATAVALPFAAACGTAADPCTVDPGHLALMNGQPLIHLALNETVYFTSTSGAAVADMVIQVSETFGHVEVYADVGATASTSSPYSTVNGRHPGLIHIPNLPATSTVSILVSAKSVLLGTAMFTLMVAQHGQAVALVDGTSAVGGVRGGDYRYFTFTAPTAGHTVSLLLTPLYGDPDLFVSTTTHTPSQQDHEWSSRARVGDAVETTVPADNTVYYMSVFGHRASRFAIMARADNKELNLYDGLPQYDFAAQGASHMYAFHVGVEAAAQGVALDVIVARGDLEMYVLDVPQGATPILPSRDPPVYNFSGQGSSHQDLHLSLGPHDYGYIAEGGVYHVLVYSSTGANYTVLGMSRAGITELRDGTPQRESCRTGEYEYFSFTVPNSTATTTFTVTPLNGDPDLYISCNSDPTHLSLTGYPSRAPGHYTWSSESLRGSESLTIHGSDANACNHGAGGGTFYVAVFGFRNTTFTLLAETDDEGPVMLQDGLPQQGTVAHLSWSYYHFYLTGGKESLTIALTALAGDPDLFVNVGGNAEPTLAHHDYQSLSSDGRDFIVVPSADLCTDCWVRIGVFGYTPARYTIAATTSLGSRVLQDGQPVQDVVAAGDYQYFRYHLDREGQTLKFLVTSLDGDADLFVSQVHTHPGQGTMFNQTWFSMYTDRMDVVAIEDAPTGDYYVGVYGFRNTTFTLLAHASAKNEAEMVTLVLGQPQVGTILTAASFAYYVLEMDDVDTTLTVSATPFSGLIGVYVNQCDEEAGNCDGANGGVDRRPSVPTGSALPNATWSSDKSLSRESVSIDTSGCHGCAYVIGVYGHTPANFSVSAVTSDSLMVLQESVPQQDYVAHFGWRYFMFTLQQPHQDIRIALTSFTGDPDLFINVCNNMPGEECKSRPTNLTGGFTWSSRGWGSETLSIPYGSAHACQPSPLRPCDYYIGVLGFQASYFSIVASLHSDRPLLLVDGVPQHGHVNASVQNNYVLDVLPGKEFIGITVTPSYGDPDVFVSLDLQKPGPSHFNYRSVAGLSQTDRIAIHSSDPQYQASPCDATLPCRVFIGVLGYIESAYTIVATTGGSATALMAGVPSQASVNEGKYVYFRFGVDVAGTTLSFTVTPINGDPDMFVSTTNERPTNGDSTWSATRAGTDTIDIFADDPGRCAEPCTYFIGVRAFGSDAAFTLVAKQRPSDPTMLVDGVPSLGSLNATQTDEYIFHFPTTLSGADLVLSPFFGDVDMYVSLDGGTPSVHHWQYISVASSGIDQVSLRTLSPKFQEYCADQALCPVRVAVFGFTDSHYMLTATTANSSVLLLANQPLRDEVARGEFKYFVFHNNQPGAAITISVTAISGDPDLFVSTTNSRPHSRSSADWSATRSGGDVLDIYPQEPHACAAPCDYYIGVRGYGNSSFVITAGNFSGAPLRLTDGVPQRGFISQGRTNRYLTTMLPHQPYLEISITPFTGDPDVFVSLGEGRLPTRHTSDFRSISGWGQDVIAINASAATAYAQHCDAAAPCAVNVAVSGFRDATYAVVAASLEGLTRVQAGVPLRGAVGANQYQYYMFTNPDPSQSVTFTVTAFGGDPDIYISAIQPRPTKGNHTWAAQEFGYDRVVINPDDPAACRTSKCHYYIGVTGFLTTAQYQLLAAVGDALHPTLLVRGQPQHGHVAYHELAFYGFDVADDGSRGDVDFVATSLNTPVGVYVVPQLSNGSWVQPKWSCTMWITSSHGVACGRYQVTGAQWASTGNAGGRVHIPGGDPNACTGCTYLVGVAALGESALGADFTITASREDGLTLLQNGVPRQDHVTQHQYRYFQLAIDEPQADLTVTVTPYTGTVVAFLSTTNHRPNVSDHQWHMSVVRHSVSVQYQDLAACEGRVELGGRCTMYIGVFGVFNSSFAITAALDQSFRQPQLLLDGVPVDGYANATQFQYYLANVIAPEGSTTTVSVTPLYGDPDLYITTDGTEPGLHNYQFRSTAGGSSVQDTVLIQPGRPHYCNHCRLLIAVRGFTTTHFSITYSTAATTTRLQDGRPQFGSVTATRYQYYSISVPGDAPTNVLVALSNQGGGAARMVAAPMSSNDQPTLEDHVWASGGQSLNTLIISHGDADACSACTYVVGVTAETNTSYYVTLSFSGGLPVSLVDGQSQAGFVPALDYTFFTFSTRADEVSGVTFRITPTIGSVELYATNLYTPRLSPPEELPTRDNSLWEASPTSAGDTRYSIRVTPSSPGFNASLTTYTLGVYGHVASVFDVSANTDDVAQTLSVGSPLPHQSVPAGSNEYFTLQTSGNAVDVKISVVPLNGGNTYLLATFNDTRPKCTAGNAAHATISCTGYMWSSLNDGGDIIRVPAAAFAAHPHASLIIAVYGVTTTQFSISAWTDAPVQLWEGNPFSGSTSEVTMCKERSSETGACLPETPSNPWYNAQGAFFNFLSSNSQNVVTITVQQPCAYSQRVCGPPLMVFVQTCCTGQCHPEDRYPDGGLAQSAMVVSGGSQTMYLDGQTVACPTGGSTTFNVGVYYYCADGQDCAPVEFDISYNDQGLNVVTQPEINGRVDSVPGHFSSTLDADYFELFTGDDEQALTVSLDACYGAVDVFMCQHECASPVHPSNTDNQWHATTNAPVSEGTGTITVANAKGQFYVAVVPQSSGASYELRVSSGAVSRLMPGSTWSVSATDESLKLSWDPAVFASNGACNSLHLCVVCALCAWVLRSGAVLCVISCVVIRAVCVFGCFHIHHPPHKAQHTLPHVCVIVFVIVFGIVRRCHPRQRAVHCVLPAWQHERHPQHQVQHSLRRPERLRRWKHAGCCDDHRHERHRGRPGRRHAVQRVGGGRVRLRLPQRRPKRVLHVCGVPGHDSQDGEVHVERRRHLWHHPRRPRCACRDRRGVPLPPLQAQGAPAAV